MPRIRSSYVINGSARRGYITLAIKISNNTEKINLPTIMSHDYDRVEPQAERAALGREGQEGVKGARLILYSPTVYIKPCISIPNKRYTHSLITKCMWQ